MILPKKEPQTNIKPNNNKNNEKKPTKKPQTKPKQKKEGYGAVQIYLPLNSDVRNHRGR